MSDHSPVQPSSETLPPETLLPETLPPERVDALLRIIDDLEAREGFPTVDALEAGFAAIAAKHPDRVTSRRIATSRLGEPIRMYSFAGGPRSHLVVGGVHPNEPIGFWTALELAELLVAPHEPLAHLNATWHIIPCIDPDGARLNESWYPDPSDRGFYARRFYRPAPDQQVEWTFPTDYKRAYFDQVLPETLGLMRVIDEVRPDFYTSLHNGEMGGVYYYVSKSLPGLTEVLHAIPRHLGLPLDTGEPEAPHFRVIAPAIFENDTVGEVYDFFESLGVDPTTVVGGSSSSEYADRHGTFSLIAELPYWSHPDADDTAEIAESYAELLQRTSDDMRETHEHLSGLLRAADPHLTIRTPFLDGSRAFVPMLEGIADQNRLRAGAPESERPATVAERFGCEDLIHCFRLRYGGMLLRAFEAEVVAGTASAELRRLTSKLEALYETWLAEPNVAEDAAVIPISSLVGVQLGAILGTSEILSERV